MPGASRATQDKAGGIILKGSSNVFVNGKPLAYEGTTIAPHGGSPHNASKILKGSSSVFVNGKGVVRAGDIATCLHKAEGSTNVNVGG